MSSMSKAAVAARVVSVGLACPVGLDATAALAAVDAGINRFVFVEPVLDLAGDPVSASKLETPVLGDTRLDRAVALGIAAIRDALSPFGKDSFPDPVPCLLAAPEPTAGGDLDALLLAGGLRRGLSGHPVELLFPDKLSAARGRAGFFDALESAVALLATNRAPAVLVGGTDSLVDVTTLQDMSKRNRLLSKINLDGNVFGEAAAFALLVHPRLLPHAQSKGEVLAIAKAQEPRPIIAVEPSTSLGLAELFRTLRACHPGRLGAVMNGVSCEGFYGMEFSNAYLRNVELMPEPLRNHTVGNAFGDVGAAAGAVAFVQAVSALNPRRGPKVSSALAYGSSDSGAVGGCIVRG